jgi:hypothetical protein
MIPALSCREEVISESGLPAFDGLGSSETKKTGAEGRVAPASRRWSYEF